MSLKNKTIDTSLWDRNRGMIRNSRGGWFAGKGVFNQGYDMMHDLVGEVSYMQVVILNVTGQLPERKVADWFEGGFICLSWPDPRIWCNHIGALAGTSGCSAVSAASAGMLASDSRAYGPKTLIGGMQFIQHAYKHSINGSTVDEIIKTECDKHSGKLMITGYARPLAKGDERVEAMERLTNNLGFKTGPHLTLAYEIERYLMETFGEGMNINGYVSAFLSDLDYTPELIYRIYACLVASGVTACYSETRDKPALTFLPQRCIDIDYQGKICRPVPEP